MKLIRKILKKLMENSKKIFIICNIILALLFDVTITIDILLNLTLDFTIFNIFIYIFYRILLILITIFNCYYIYNHPKDKLIIMTFFAIILSIPLFIICLETYILMILTYIILFIIINKPKLSTLKNIIFIICNISLSLLYYIMNEKDFIIKIYPMVIIILITIFNCYYIYKNPKNNLVGAIAITTIVYSLPYDDSFPILYFLIFLSYIVFFIVNKQKVLTVIGIVFFILTLTFSIEYINSENSNKAVDIGFSTNKKYYSYCESYKFENNKLENKFY